MLIKGRENVRIKESKNPKEFINYLQTIDAVSENLENYNLAKKVSIVFDDIVADMKANTKLSPIVTELFLRGKKVNIFIAFHVTILFRGA